MYKLSLFLLLGILISSFHLNAQSNPDMITEKKRLGAVFIQHEKALKPKQMVLLMQPIPEADGYMKKAKSSFDLASGIGFVGGALIGWPLGTAIAGGEPEWALMGIGAGLIVVSIPISNSYSRNARRAVGIYNQQL